MNNKVVANGGISFVGLLQIVFIVLKLCKVINWHWALVMLPLEISVGTAVIALIANLSQLNLKVPACTQRIHGQTGGVEIAESKENL